MKRCELIRNVASTVCMGALGFGIIGAAFMSLPETLSVLGVAFLMGIISFVMDKIAHEKA